MTGLLLLGASLLTVLVVSELVLAGTKLQTGLSRVLVVWAGIHVPSAYVLCQYGGVGPIPFTIFWGGAFLSWFGVRSHIESSILLRMLFLLRRKPMAEGALIAEYTSLYGEGMRREELFRGGLAVREGGSVVVSAKGKVILAVVSKLR